MSATLGESTRRRLGGVVGGANPSGGMGATTRPGTRDGFGRGPSVGGYEGGMGGTWGKAGTGRSGGRPATAGGAPAPLNGAERRAIIHAANQRALKERWSEYSPKLDRALGPDYGRQRKSLVGQPEQVGHVMSRNVTYGMEEATTYGGGATGNHNMTSTMRPPPAPIAPTMGGGGGGGGGRGMRPQTAPLTQNRVNVVYRDEYLPQFVPQYPSDDERDGDLAVGLRAANMQEKQPQLGLPPLPMQPQQVRFDPSVPARESFENATTTPSKKAAVAPVPVRGTSNPPVIAPLDPTSGVTSLQIANAEENLRDAFRNKKSMTQTMQNLMKKLHKAVDDGDALIEPDELVKIGNILGVKMSVEVAQGVFTRNGFESSMPMADFEALFGSERKSISNDLAVKQKAFSPDEQRVHMGKMVYPQCRTIVQPPSDFTMATLQRSAQVPDKRLRLEFVYGYDGMINTSNNLFYNVKGDLVYHTAGIGVVYSKPPAHSQSFFLGHSDDIHSLAVCPAPQQYQGFSLEARRIVATGQVSTHEGGPEVCVWDSVTNSDACSLLQRIPFGKDARLILAVGFSADGELLGVLTGDNQHTVYVYDWKRNKVVGEGKSANGEPPQVFGLEWNQHTADFNMPPEFITYGKKSIKRWRRDASKGGWAPTPLAFGKGALQNVHSAVFLPPVRAGASGEAESAIAAGMADGSIYIFRGSGFVRAIKAHASGPSSIQSDGSKSFPGLRAMRLVQDHTAADKWTLYSGGADGLILRWDASTGDVTQKCAIGTPIQLGDPYGGAKRSGGPAIRGLDVNPANGSVAVGTDGCDLFEVSETTQEIFMDGHEGDIWGCAFHPTKDDVFATACESNKVFRWSSRTRSVVKLGNVGMKARVCAFSQAPVALPGAQAQFHLAVGGDKGKVVVLSEEEMEPLLSFKDANSAITCIAYSPNNKMLAVGSADASVGIYSVEKGYRPLARCTGHSASITGLDWSADSGVIQVAASSYELLYFDAKTGKQVFHNQKDTRWATWSSVLGFPVMGIWPDGSDGTDVNAVDRSPDGKYLVTANDDGLVRLINYPVVVEDAPYRAYRGHSSHVMMARFNRTGTMVVSVGGKDRSVLQFVVMPATDGADMVPPSAPHPEPPVWTSLDEQGKSFGRAPRPPATSQSTAGASSRRPSLPAWAEGAEEDAMQQQHQELQAVTRAGGVARPGLPPMPPMSKMAGAVSIAAPPPPASAPLYPPQQVAPPPSYMQQPDMSASYGGRDSLNFSVHQGGLEDVDGAGGWDQ